MIDCEITENFLREKYRMCKSVECKQCKLSYSNNGIKLGCWSYSGIFPDEIIKIVQQWSDSHPHEEDEK